MKKLFNHTKRPNQEWEEYDESEYDWDSEEQDEEDDEAQVLQVLNAPVYFRCRNTNTLLLLNCFNKISRVNKALHSSCIKPRKSTA